MRFVRLGFLWGVLFLGRLDGVKGDQRDPQAGHKAICGSKGLVARSQGHVGGGLGLNK